MTLVLCLALAAFAAVTVSRLLPGLRILARYGVKPVACDSCWSSWMSLAASCALAWQKRAWQWCALGVPATGLCLLLLRAYDWLVTPPPDLPPAEPPPGESPDEQ